MLIESRVSDISFIYYSNEKNVNIIIRNRSLRWRFSSFWCSRREKSGRTSVSHGRTGIMFRVQGLMMWLDYNDIRVDGMTVLFSLVQLADSSLDLVGLGWSSERWFGAEASERLASNPLRFSADCIQNPLESRGVRRIGYDLLAFLMSETITTLHKAI